MLQEQADLDGARAAFEAGVAMGDPTSMRLLTSMGYTVVASDEGVSSTAGTTSDMVVTMAQQAYHAGALSPQAYEKDLRGVIDRDQGSAGDLARAALARLLEERGDWAAAEQLYREVVDGDHAGQPFHAASALNLGNLLLGQQRLEEGEAMLKVAVATGDLEASAKAAFTLAPVLMRRGAWRRARRHCRPPSTVAIRRIPRLPNCGGANCWSASVRSSRPARTWTLSCGRGTPHSRPRRRCFLLPFCQRWKTP